MNKKLRVSSTKFLAENITDKVPNNCKDFSVCNLKYRTAGYCCEVQIFATLLKWLLAEISAIAKFVRLEADFHWILCQENAWAKFYSLENIRISLFQQKFFQVEPSFTNFTKIWTLHT